MVKENITRCKCDRCIKTEEIKAGIFSRYPPGWKQIEGCWLCPECVSKNRERFRGFVSEGKRND